MTVTKILFLVVAAKLWLVVPAAGQRIEIRKELRGEGYVRQDLDVSGELTVERMAEYANRIFKGHSSAKFIQLRFYTAASDHLDGSYSHVSYETLMRIRELIEGLPLVVGEALYLQGSWIYRFRPVSGVLARRFEGRSDPLRVAALGRSFEIVFVRYDGVIGEDGIAREEATVFVVGSGPYTEFLLKELGRRITEIVPAVDVHLVVGAVPWFQHPVFPIVFPFSDYRPPRMKVVFEGMDHGSCFQVKSTNSCVAR